MIFSCSPYISNSHQSEYKPISRLVVCQLINAYVFIMQNIYCLSISYKGACENSSLVFWNKTLLSPIFATP
jgi:hypothetical protein